MKADWQPIETAPKDGTQILLLFPNAVRFIGYWELYFAKGGTMFDARYLAWAENFSGERLHNYHGEPTHWMPLPEPPMFEEKP